MTRPMSRLSIGLGLGLAALANVVAAQNYAQPAKEHEFLANDVGTWDAEVSMWVAPDQEPIKSKAVETNQMLGKFWVMGQFEGEFGGEKFSGRSATGWDPIKKKYVGGWVDTMSPFMIMMEGDYDPATKTVTMMGKGTDFMTGKPAAMKMVTRWEDDDNKVFEMYAPAEGQEGEWTKTMEARYKRRK